MRQMFASAFQSDLFNRVLERRLAEIDSVREGDLAYLHRNGAVFKVEDVAEARPRCAAFEISPSGPIYGTDVPLADGEPGRIEREVLSGSGLTLDRFEVGGGIRLHGLRRSLRTPLQEVAIRPLDDTSFEVEFVLPSGAFATSVMREITKAPAPPPTEDP
jgi:tRNA pseudouridine13 synthase